MTALQRLQSPLHSSAEVDPRQTHDPLAAVVAAMIDPLKNAASVEEWRARYQWSLPQWTKLRLAVNRHVLSQADTNIDDIQEQAAQAPLTLLREPAGGAARYARELLFWLTEEAARSARRGAPILNEYRFAAIEEDVASIELCWLTLLRVEPPKPAVAEEAAWAAYASARHLRQWLPYIGFERARLPREDSHQASLRARAMLKRLASTAAEAVPST